MLVVGRRVGNERTGQGRPLVTVIEANPRTALSTGKCRIQVQRIGIELRELRILAIAAPEIRTKKKDRTLRSCIVGQSVLAHHTA